MTTIWRNYDDVEDAEVEAFKWLEARCDELGFDDGQKKIFYDLIWADAEKAMCDYGDRWDRRNRK